MINKNKKGLSPVIATVVLIAIVVTIGLIIFFWFRGLAEETITKFGKKNIKLVCNDVEFESSYSNGVVSISNSGNVPIYSINMKVSTPGGFITYDFQVERRDESLTWPEIGLGQGEAYSENILGYLTNANEILLIPILVGNSDKGEKIHICEERHGNKLTIEP